QPTQPRRRKRIRRIRQTLPRRRISPRRRRRRRQRRRSRATTPRAENAATQSLRLTTALAPGQEGVHRPDGSIKPFMLEIFREDFRETVVFGIRPKVRVKPTELVRRTTSHRVAHDRLVWIENGELQEELLCFPKSVD